jgi:hypothetical protein
MESERIKRIIDEDAEDEILSTRALNNDTNQRPNPMQQYQHHYKAQEPTPYST